MNHIPRRINCVRAVLAFLLCGCMLHPGTAFAGEPVATKPEAPAWRAYPLRNVSPRVMAWWLDSRNNVKPDELRQKPVIGSFWTEWGYDQPSQGSPFTSLSLKEQSDGGFDNQGPLPVLIDTVPGAEAVVAVETRKEILVLATAEGQAKMHTLIDYLDRPIYLVMLHALYVEFDAAVARTLVTEERSLTQPVSTFQDQLKNLTQQGKAKVLADEWVTLMNNLGAEFGVPLPEDYIRKVRESRARYGWHGDDDDDNDGAGSAKADAVSADVELKVPLRLNFLTPTINNDDTVSMFLSPGPEVFSSSDLTRPRGSSMQMVFTLKPGEVRNLGDLLEFGRRPSPNPGVPPPARIRYAFISAQIASLADPAAIAPAHTKE